MLAARVTSAKLDRAKSGRNLMISHRIVAAFCVLFAGFLAFQPGAARAERAVITELRAAVHDDRTRLVLELSHEIQAQIFTLTDPARVVIDLPEVGWRLPPRALPAETGLLKRLRYGLFKPGVTRLVVDAGEPVSVRDAFQLKGVEGKGTRLVIDMAGTSEAKAAALRGKRQRVAGISDETIDRTDPPVLTAAAPPVQAAMAPQISRFGLPPLKPAAFVAPRQSRARGRLIVIDPGHGGVDPGAIAPSGIYEKHIALAFSRELRNQLEAAGYRVKLTRDRDIFIRLRDRVTFAREAEADLFISVHADSIKRRDVRGLAVYTLSEKASDDEAAALAEKENKSDLIAGINLENESDDVANILIDLAQRETMNESSRFAELLVGKLKRRTKVLKNSHRFAGFRVLKAPDVPSVLLELGFLSNRQDEKALKTKSYRRKLATATVEGVEAFFNRTESASWP
ncbi:MAG: N-acetylmuramoyl-L-alanine amidase [Magnetovibrionaceae bacterium]